MGWFSNDNSKTSSNSTNITYDNRQTDAKVSAAEGANVVTAGAGRLNYNAGGNIGSNARVTVNNVDPGAFSFASDLIHQVFGANASSGGGSSSPAPVVFSGAASPASAGSSGFNWSKLLLPVGIVGALVVGLVVIRKRRARA